MVLGQLVQDGITRQCCPADSIHPLTGERRTERDLYPQNPICPCESDRMCCEGDTWKSNKEHCECDSCNECCDKGTLYPEHDLLEPNANPRRAEKDKWPENENCPCNSATHCCPGDVWTPDDPCRCPCDSKKECCINMEQCGGVSDTYDTNPTHCPCHREQGMCCDHYPLYDDCHNNANCPLIQGECCMNEDWSTNKNCPCEEDLDEHKCCKVHNGENWWYSNNIAGCCKSGDIRCCDVTIDPNCVHCECAFYHDLDTYK